VPDHVEPTPLPPDRWRRALRRERKRARLSQAALATLTDHWAATVSDWERGAYLPSGSSVETLRGVLPGLPSLDQPGPDRDGHLPSRGHRGLVLRRSDELERRPEWARSLYLRRIERGWSMRDLSHATGIQVPQISAYETGRGRPSVQTEQRILRALAGAAS
jgi:transcriptional regulator with XRE-family HTH domain